MKRLVFRGGIGGIYGARHGWELYPVGEESSISLPTNVVR